METGRVEERKQKNINCIHKSQLIDLTNLNLTVLGVPSQDMAFYAVQILKTPETEVVRKERASAPKSSEETN